MLAQQRFALAQNDGLDVLAHELLVPGLQLRHFAAPQDFLAEVLVGVHVEVAGVVLIEGIVTGPVVARIDDAALAEVFAPGMVAVTGQQGVVEIE